MGGDCPEGGASWKGLALPLGKRPPPPPSARCLGPKTQTLAPTPAPAWTPSPQSREREVPVVHVPPSLWHSVLAAQTAQGGLFPRLLLSPLILSPVHLSLRPSVPPTVRPQLCRERPL